MLALRYAEAEELAKRRKPRDWTAYQISDEVVLDGLRADREQWAEYKDPQKRNAALSRFHKYVYQWY